MATIGEITQAASYRGDAALGGGLGIGITLDPTPLQRLANFTYYRDRDIWENKLKEDQVAARQVADIAAYDITSPFKEYSDDLKRELNDIQSFVRENPDALVYSRNPKKFTELNEKINRFSTKRKAATVNDTLYNAAKARTDQIVDPNERDIAKRELDLKVNRLFSGGLDNAYNQQLESISPIKPSDYTIPTPARTQRSFILQGPNEDITTEVNYTDLDDLKAKSELMAAGAMPEDISKQDWFKRLSPEQQKLELDKNTLTTSKRRALQELAVNFKNSFDMWKAANPGIDVNTVDLNTLPDGIIENNIRAAKSINDQIDQLNTYVLEGKIKDPAGRVRTVPYGKINFADGLSESELVFMKAIQEDKNSILSQVEKKITGTNTAIERGRLGIEGMNAQTARMNAQTARMNATRSSGGGTAETTTSGNAFDEIGGTEQVDIFETNKKQTTATGEKIIDGIVYDRKGKKKTGKVMIPINAIPQNMIAALKSAGTDLSGTINVELVVKDGQINSVRPDEGSPISRQAMENAQKKFDTERKGAEPLNWGRTINKPLTGETISIKDVPTGTKLEEKNGKFYYKGKEVI